MVEYHCKLCSFSTIFTTNYKKHLQSKKHLGKVKEQEEQKKKDESKMNPIESKMNPTESLKKYICQFCNKGYSTNSNLHKHLKKCNKYIQDQKEEFKNESKNESKNVINLSSNVIPMSSQCHPNVIPMSSNHKSSLNYEENKKPQCPYCFSYFASRQGKFKHL